MDADSGRWEGGGRGRLEGEGRWDAEKEEGLAPEGKGRVEEGKGREDVDMDFSPGFSTSMERDIRRGDWLHTSRIYAVCERATD